MVRETRHLWVGNLPDNIREDRIREHFKRYGRVQNVKLLGRTENSSVVAGSSTVSGVCATVAFMDIKSASKAHNAEHVLDERTLTTDYYEPAAIPSAAGAPSAGSSPAGSGYSGSSSSVNSAPAPSLSVSRYHLSGGEESTSNTCAIAAAAAAPANWRGTNDSASEYCRRGNTPSAYSRYQRNNSTAPYVTPPSNVERTTPHHRWYVSGERTAGATGGESTPSTPGGGTESGRRRRLSGSGSSRSDSSSPEPSDTSRASTPAAPPPHTHPHHGNHRNTPSHQHQWASTASGRPLAICVRNLPTRSTDSSLKDGLYHEYKKHGKVVWVKVVGQNADRYAIVRFKKPSDVEKALEVSQDKLFFGCKISVAPHQSCDEDADSAKPYETDIDEYHPKATRTLFIGNLEKDVTQQQLREKFKHFGRIIEIDIKKGSSGGAGYAFCQYASISSVVEAIRAMDGEYVGGSRVKLGFGKPVATACVWVDGLTEHTEKQVLGAVSRCGGATSVCVDRAAGAALVHFEQAAAAGVAVRELRRVAAHASSTEHSPDHPRLCVDYASRECQEAFYEQLEKHGGSAALTGSERLSGDLTTRYLPSTRHEPVRYDSCGSRSRASSYGRGSSRTPRYTTLDHYDPADYAADRRYRVYDELGSSPQTEDTPYEDRLQSVVVSPHRARRHRRDSSTEDRKHSKERHRSVSGATRRSRSGSRGGERHAGRRRHRRRRDGSGSRGSRTGTPLRDELDALPAEPRRPPRDRPPLPMSLPLPKFAALLLRTAPPTPRPAPAPAPDSPPRPPSASSSSAGSAPHSPSLEERIRSLDEKYEKWTGSRAQADAPDRARLRHRLLEVDINEVKPSEVVRSLLAKRSIFDEDSERLEGTVRPPSPIGSPRSKTTCLQHTLRYPFPAHPPPLAHSMQHSPIPLPTDVDPDASDRPADPRLNRPERPYQMERLGKFNESDYRLEPRVRLRTPSTDKSQPDSSDRSKSPRSDRELITDIDKELRRDKDRKARDAFFRDGRNEQKSFEVESKSSPESVNSTIQSREKPICMTRDRRHLSENIDILEEKLVTLATSNNNDLLTEKKEKNQTDCVLRECEENMRKEVTDLLLKHIEEQEPCVKQEPELEKKVDSSNECLVPCENKTKSESVTETLAKLDSVNKLEHATFPSLKNDTDKSIDTSIQNHLKKDLVDFDVQQNHLNISNTIKTVKDLSELSKDFKCVEKVNRACNPNVLEVFQITRLEKENIEYKSSEKDKYDNVPYPVEKKVCDSEKHEERVKSDRDKIRHSKERSEKDKHDSERLKSNKNEKQLERNDKEKKSKEEVCTDRLLIDKIKIERDDKPHKEKNDRDGDKLKHVDEKSSRHDHSRKDKFNDKDKRKDSSEMESQSSKIRKDEKNKHERSKKENIDYRRESKKESESSKSRKSSRDESSRDLCRKDSTDSSASRASHDSSKNKELDNLEIKEETKSKVKYYNDLFVKQEPDLLTKPVEPAKLDHTIKIKTEIKEEKEPTEQYFKSKIESVMDQNIKCKSEVIEKQRHYSLDSPSVDSKRKERLNSCSSLPSNIGHKRRMSSQDSFDCLNEDLKKCRNESKYPERRDSKDSRNTDRHKTAKFNKGHFAKIIESKTKDDKKNQVKPPDDVPVSDLRENDKDSKISDKIRLTKKSPKIDNEDKLNSDNQSEPKQNDFDFLATLELRRSSEEDEKQKAIRKEMKEKKRIQQLQQIQQLQMQQDALQQADLINKLKEDKKQKTDDRKKEAAREKRMSIDRKSRDEKPDSNKRRSRKQIPSTDSSDSDEPKKHSIFDIIDDEPTYISMYDKVKARSCKNMQKQEEEKRQEKIKAKFSQLKQSRAKREEKKRSSWDEDSDSEHEGRKPLKTSMDSSSEDEQIVIHNKKREKSNASSLDYDHNKSNDGYGESNNEDDTRNKLSRKNSRTRIMSDTSDDETSKRSSSKSPNFLNDVKTEVLSDFESSQRNKTINILCKELNEDKNKKNSLLNLFGKSDSEDNKLKSSIESDKEYKYNKTILNDFSSECESIISNRNCGENRKEVRKHKKKQKKHKFSCSEDDMKVESNEIADNIENKHKNSEKNRRHSSKKEKRRERNRDSIDTDDTRDEKNKYKKEKRSTMNCFDLPLELNTNNKKDGKMEDIFGPISDESDRDTRGGSQNISKSEFVTHEYDSSYRSTVDRLHVINNSHLLRLKEKDENKRKKEKRRKEKRYFMKEDDNSLDVDAVGKAIEARLIADTNAEVEPLKECFSKNEQHNNHHANDQLTTEIRVGDKHNDRLKKECKEKKKKKKRNKEDRQNRKDHHHFHHHDKLEKSGHLLEELEITPNLADIPLPSDPEIIKVDTEEDTKSVPESTSLPRLTDSPPMLIEACENNVTKTTESEVQIQSAITINSKIDNTIGSKEDEKNHLEENHNSVTSLAEAETMCQEVNNSSMSLDLTQSKNNSVSENFISSFDSDVEISENAVRSISNLEKDTEKLEDKDCTALKLEKKSDEKPRAIISQEETEDAVAALLGESFGGKVNTFANCYEEVENETTRQIETENTSIESENIPEEDAEEMRQAVQNLNACEMELKPDTPVSDNDLLLIDTDTEEGDESIQDIAESVQPAKVATNSHQSQQPLKRSEPNKSTEATNIAVSTQNPKTSTTETITTKANETSVKTTESEMRFTLPKRETSQQLTSTATPVITTWTLTNNKIEQRVLKIKTHTLPNRDANENKSSHITANILQLKSPQNQSVPMNNNLRPIIAPNRMSAPYQVINQMIRPQSPNIQPPTIKIPEPHVLYQKQQGIVISPRMSNEPRLQSPKASSQGEPMTSPRLTNMTILSTSPHNLNSVGIPSPNTIQQRSPGQVTVVRMQQPPLSPIQAMHMPHSARAMVSPNRPNSVLVPTQGAPIHFNRLPVAPILAPISKQLNTNNMAQQTKGINSAVINQQKIISGDNRKSEQRPVNENINEKPKIILSPTSLQQSTNPTVMAQNRLISMQNAMHVGNLNSTLQLSNKVLLNNVNPINDKRDNLIQKSEQHNHLPFSSSPIIHVAGIKHSTGSIIQSSNKPIMCTLQEPNAINRGQGPVIHTLNSQKLLTTASLNNVIQIDANKGPPSVLSMATVRPSTVLTKVETSNSPAVTTSSISNVPLLLKNVCSTQSSVRINMKKDTDNMENHVSLTMNNSLARESESKLNEYVDSNKTPSSVYDHTEKQKDILMKPVNSSLEHVTKCETDFEELLKDNTNEIKVSNDPDKKLEVNVGKTVTLITKSCERKISVENQKDDPGKLGNIISENSRDIIVSESNETHQNKNESSNINSSKTENFKNMEEAFADNIKIDKNISFDSNSAVDKSVIAKVDNISDKTADFLFCHKNDDQKIFSSVSNLSEDSDNQLKSLDENDSWSAKDVNIDSVIKKVDSLCNDTIDFNEKKDDDKPEQLTKIREVNDSQSVTHTEPSSAHNSDSVATVVTVTTEAENVKPIEMQTENISEHNHIEDFGIDKNLGSGKRGGRSVRGKKTDRQSDRVQTRQISKPSTRGTTGKRGRGRAKVDKKIKNFVNSNQNNIPGDVYDFHEDSGDETTTSPNKTSKLMWVGSPPRLILTIKSPLSGQPNAVATSTLSIAQKDQLKLPEKATKDEKSEDFISPSPNTRKSRRLQEKDVQRTTVDDVIDDVIKGTGVQTKSGKDKDTNKKRATRQFGVKTNNMEKLGTDTRKSPRGVKRTRDRSLSDASIDSSDEKIFKKDDTAKESKIPKLGEPVEISRMEPEPLKLSAPLNNPPLPPPSTPIMKPPKKMISEISAKLACAFEAAATAPLRNTPPTSTPERVERLPAEADKQTPMRELRNPEPATATPAVSELVTAAIGDTRAESHSLDVGFARRLVDSVPGNMMPVGATEATDARVQSPALPHRPPSTHRPADRATPVLIRGGDGEGAVCATGGAGGPSRGYRAAYAATASLPRGAHHPPPPPHHLHPAKQVAVVGPHPHHHHPHTHQGAASRVTITSVPNISPQGQVPMSAELVRSPPPAHQQTSPVTSGEPMYPQFSHQHYQMYQQHFRATQHENRATPSPYTRSLEAEGSEAPTPPLELRRPPSARVPRPAHSPSTPSPSDRLIMYAVGCGRSPPPAHGTSRLPGALPPSAAPGPPHASQVPREADSLQMLLRRYPVMWQGLLALKNDSAAVQMHFVGGNPGVAGDTLPRHTDGSTPPLRIAQRMRLEPAQLDQVHRKMKMENEHCMLLALPCGRDHMDVLQQSTNLTAGFITYLQRKQAAGIVNVAPPGHQQAMYTVHIFPSCDFANENLNRIAPDLMHRVADIAHLLIVIATV